MMGGQSSKRRGDGALPSIQSNMNAPLTADLSSYEAACRLDPELQSFNISVHERTNRVINTLATGVEVRSLSFDSLNVVTDCLMEMNQEVVKVILESKKDIWNNQEMFPLVEEYFENSLITMDFCTSLESCLKRARNSQLIIKVAIQQFDGELADGVEGRRFVKTLNELKNFKAAGDPFTEEFSQLLTTVISQQKSMMQKLQVRKRKLDKKMKSVKVWRKVSNVIFVAAFVSVLIFSVVAAAIAAPPVVIALAGALAVPIGSIGKWCNSLLNGYETAFKEQKDIISSMVVGTCITMIDLDHIRVLVDRLQIQIESILHNAEFASREEDAVKLVIDEIKKKLEEFTEIIESLSTHADQCSRNIRRARTVILQRIIKNPKN